MRFGLIAYPKMPLNNAHSGVSRETICLKVVRSLLQLALFIREAKVLRGHAYMQARRSLRHTPI